MTFPAMGVGVQVLVTFVVVVTMLQAGLFLSACFELHRLRQRDRHQLWRRMLGSPLAPRISVLVPAYNEEVTIADTVASMLALSYPNLEVVVVSDGSTDRTVDILVDCFDLTSVHPVYQRTVRSQDCRGMFRAPLDARLVVLDKFNGGKADALNLAINVASGELVCAVDADTLVSPDALQQLVAPFLTDDAVVAVGGPIRLVNDSIVQSGRVRRMRAPRHPLAGAQAVEYVRSFIVGRLGWNPLGGNILVSGAFGLFRRSALLEAGGYERDSIGEDLELVVRLRRLAYEAGRAAKVVFVADPVAWTEAPESLRTLARQRNRWYRGLMDVMVRHRRMVFNPRYRSAGLLALPYYLLVEMLSPLVELAGLVTVFVGYPLGWVEAQEVQVVATAYVLGIALTQLMLIFDDIAFRSYPGLNSRLRMVGHTVAEALVLRPATTVWRLWGLVLFARGRKEWGTQVRKGFAADG